MHVSPPIVINATNVGRYADGIGVYVLNLLRELARLDDSRRFIIYLNRTGREHLRDICFPDRHEIRWVSGLISPDHGFRGHLLRLLFSHYLGLRHPRSVIFITGQLEAIFWRRNQIIMVHDVIPLLFPHLHPRQVLYFRYYLRSAVRRARWVLSPSRHTRDLLARHYGIPAAGVRVIHHGVREAAPRRPVPDGERHREDFILFSGRIAPMKNLEALIRAFGLLSEKIPHRLVITGHGRAAALRALRSVNAADRVEFRGYVSSEELVDLLDRASLLAFPTLYEGFGLPPLEGMAHGCPAIVSNVASLPEVCGDAARYVDPEDVRSIADGMYQLLTDRVLWRRLSARGVARAGRFRWRDAAVDHLRVFDEARAFHAQRRPARQIRRPVPTEAPLRSPERSFPPDIRVPAR